MTGLNRKTTNIPILPTKHKFKDNTDEFLKLVNAWDEKSNVNSKLEVAFTQLFIVTENKNKQREMKLSKEVKEILWKLPKDNQAAILKKIESIFNQVDLSKYFIKGGFDNFKQNYYAGKPLPPTPSAAGKFGQSGGQAGTPEKPKPGQTIGPSKK